MYYIYVIRTKAFFLWTIIIYLSGAHGPEQFPVGPLPDQERLRHQVGSLDILYGRKRKRKNKRANTIPGPEKKNSEHF